MAKKGIAQIKGSKVLKLGEIGHYHVSKIYRQEDDNKVPHAKWKLYIKENNNWRELKPVAGTPPKIGSKTTITITNQKLLGKELLLEAYLYEPEKSSPPGLIIKVEEGRKKIERVDLFRTDDSPISKGAVLKYGQSIIVKVITVNMPNEKVEITLYEDDEDGEGHNPNNEKNKVDSVEKPLDKDGFAMHTFNLRIDFQKIANAYKDGSQDKFHEYYINVKSPTDSKASRNVKIPNPEYTFPEQEIEEVVISVKAKEVGIDPLPETGRTVSIVKEVKIEDLIDAYFAKKEYTNQTGEEAGTFEYKFAGNGNKTENDTQKNNIAKAILGKPNVVGLKDKKQYTTIEAIKIALTADVYNKEQKITFKTFKLGEEFKRVNNAPLEEKLYLVATTSMMDGNEVTLSIKEKDGIIKGSAGAILPVLEITEEQMEQKNSSGEVQGTEKTEFKGTVQEGIVKIPIQLRPKSDDELKQWKNKLAKGKQDGTYTYTFASQTSIPNGSGDEKKRIAGIILNNAKNGLRENQKIENGKTAFAEDIEKALTEERYLAGEKIEFKLYTKQEELLYLQAKAQGERPHDKEFLKQDGAYFQIGKKCECEERIRAFMRVIRIAEGTGEYVKGTKTPRDPQLGYTTWFSGTGNNFTLSDDHPRVINSNSTNTLRSSAAGAYQFMSWKFDELNGKTVIFKNGYFQTAVPEIYTEARDKAKKYDAKGFEEIAQDRLCVIILKDIGAITKLLNDDIKGAISTSSGTWVSLPGATAGQPTAKMEETLDYYEEFLKEELAGNSHLHIQKGFLKDFDITCTCGNESSSSWRHPLDRMELRGWYGSGFYPGDSDHGAAEVRFSKHHEGLDLYAPVGTEVYACVDGEIYEDYISGTYGKTLGIRGTYNGETYYFFYAHLSERSVAKGDKVTAGDPIGKTGQSGNASGQAAKMDHLHFEVRTTSARTGGRIDPIATIDELKNDVITNPDQTTQTGN